MEHERRAFAVENFKIEKREGKLPIIRGYAAVFSTLSENLGGFREMILPGAFTEAIKNDDVRALFNHNPDHILGRNRSGTLTLSEDDRGLAIEIDPPDTTITRDLITSIERGDISQMSFAFSVRADGQDWDEDEDGQVIRKLKSVRLFDVSPVTYPAYLATDVAVRSMTAWKNDKKTKSENDDWQLDNLKRRQQLIESDL